MWIPPTVHKHMHWIMIMRIILELLCKLCEFTFCSGFCLPCPIVKTASQWGALTRLWHKVGCPMSLSLHAPLYACILSGPLSHICVVLQTALWCSSGLGGKGGSLRLHSSAYATRTSSASASKSCNVTTPLLSVSKSLNVLLISPQKPVREGQVMPGAAEVAAVMPFLTTDDPGWGWQPGRGSAPVAPSSNIIVTHHRLLAVARTSRGLFTQTLHEVS